MDYDVVIVGGGPAGLTAGIYCVRRNLKTVLLEKMALGGQMLMAGCVENYPGFKSISGSELAEKMESQARELGLEISSDEVTEMTLDSEAKTLKTAGGKEYKTKAVIIASGGQHRKLDVKGEEEYLGRGVSYCATCDAPFYKGKTVAVVGGGNTAVDEALYLADVADKLYLIHRRDKLRAEEVRHKRLEEKKVELILDSVVEEVCGDKTVTHLKVKNTVSGEVTELKVDGVFISIGSMPASEPAKKAGVDVDEKGFIKVNNRQETNIPGVYAAGDVTGGIQQVATAVGEGCTAALQAYEYIENPYWRG